MDVVSYLLAKARNDSGSGGTASNFTVLTEDAIEGDSSYFDDEDLSEITIIEFNGLG